MKHYPILFLTAGIAVTTVSCNKTKASPEAKKENSDSANVVKEIPEIHKELYGIYTGAFDGERKQYDEEYGEYTDHDYKNISIKINRITADSVYGHSVVNGTQRPFRGIYNDTEKTFVLDEPGNDKTDGRFMVRLKADSMLGKWDVYKKNEVKFPSKTLKLTKKTFVYNPNFMLDSNSELIDWSNPKEFERKFTDEETGKTESYKYEQNRFASDAVFKLNASKQKLTEKELKNLRKLDLEIIKNAVFARHGYSFKKETYRNFFENTDWYIPVSNNVDNDLSALEKDNVVLLNRFIKYAEDKYDYFGR